MVLVTIELFRSPSPKVLGEGLVSWPDSFLETDSPTVSKGGDWCLRSVVRQGQSFDVGDGGSLGVVPHPCSLVKVKEFTESTSEGTHIHYHNGRPVYIQDRYPLYPFTSQYKNDFEPF